MRSPRSCWPNGLLNSSVARSLEDQRRKGVKLRGMIYDIARHGQENIDPKVVSRPERRKLIQDVLQQLPATLSEPLGLSESATTIQDEGDRLLGAVIITFDAIYYTHAPLPGSLELPDLERLHTEYNLSGDQAEPADRAKSIIEGLEE